MGNREDLLAGARAAILKRGLAKTTARDIAGAAGVSLSAIGYHFGSKDRLIAVAISSSLTTEVGDELEAAIRDEGGGKSLWDALAPTWELMREIQRKHSESILLSTENAMLVARSPELQEFTSDATEVPIEDLAKALHDVHPELTTAASVAVAKLFFLAFHGSAMLSLTASHSVQVTGAEFALAVRVLRGI
ncbi:TetR/AcrR family transcriptional regulator [Nocardia tengchongensis]|uniref:TetR/AcrR family transcriptional regulator n=1 Tax=Nocardia tengchongensis TaxID=2055889 RepID=UPI003692D83E